MEVEQLIDSVREKPILWNLNHVYFRDVFKKRDAWEVVAEECGLRDGEDARQAWAKLRNSHREAMRRRLDDKTMKPWKYEEQMEFVLTGNIEKKSSFTVTDVKEIERKEKYNIETVDVEICDENESDYEETSTSTAVVESKKDKLKPKTSARNKSVKRKRFIESNDTNESDFEANEISERIPPTSSHKEFRERDGLTELFTSLCEKTRNLPKNLQLRVQREIFYSITNAEEEALTMNLTPVLKKRVIRKSKKKIKKSIARSDDVNIPDRDHHELDNVTDVTVEFIKTDGDSELYDH